MNYAGHREKEVSPGGAETRVTGDIKHEANRILLARYAPAGVLVDDDLRIDPGRIMIVITALQSGGLRFEYEVKRADNYEAVVLPEVKTIEEAEKAIARLLAEYPRDRD